MSPLFPLLALIARSDAHGYELKRIIDTEFASLWQIDFAQLYRSLAKLRADKLVRVKTLASADGPERKQYSITARGVRALEQWLRAPAPSHQELLLKKRLAEAFDFTETLPLLVAGSDDPLLAQLAQVAQARSQVIGSTAGLLALAQQQADVVGAHLREPEADEFNISFVQHLAAEQDIVLVQLAVREYGLLVARGNPKNIRSVRDLARRGARIINRSQGSGARLWLQRHLRAAHIDPLRLRGWSNSAPTYEAVARAIAANTADAGPGLRVTAEQFGVGFVVLGQERFDLAMPRAVYASARGRNLRAILHSQTFREFARTLPGYDLTRSGRVIAELKYGTRKT